MKKIIVSWIILSEILVFSGCASNDTSPNIDVVTSASVSKDIGKSIAKEFKKIETEMAVVSSDILSKKTQVSWLELSKVAKDDIKEERVSTQFKNDLQTFEEYLKNDSGKLDLDSKKHLILVENMVTGILEKLN